MGRKKDIQLINLQNKVEYIEGNLDDALTAQHLIIKKHNDALIEIRNLLNKLIEGE